MPIDHEVRRAKRLAQKAVSSFYKEQRNEDLPTLVKQAKHRRIWLFITTSLAILFGLALLGFYVFGGFAREGFGEEAFQVSLQGPVSVPSGQTVEYTLNYKNDQGVGLNFVELDFHYPPGFLYRSSSIKPLNKDNSRFELNGVKGRAEGSVTIQGQVVGEVGDKKDIKVVITYQPDNLKAEFSKTVSTSTSLVASVLNLDVSGPAQLPADQPLKLDVSYNNSSTTKIDNLLLKLTPPQGFSLQVPSLAPFSNTTNIWQLPALEPRAASKIQLVGNFTDAASQGQQEIRIAVGLASADGKEFTLQEEKVFTLSLIRSHLTLNLKSNGNDIKSTADVGGELTYSLDFKNEGDLLFSNLVLVATLDRIFLDWSTLQDENKGTINRDQGTITWTKNELAQLAEIKPGNGGTLKWHIRTVSKLPDGVTNAPLFVSKVNVTGESTLNNKTEAMRAESNELTTRINTQLTLNAQARYYSNESVKLGSGPLPPRVGATTTYVILWQLGNSFSEVNNVEVTTTLPPGITWTGQANVTAGQQVSYNSNTREVRWNLNRLPVGAGTFFAKPEASFEVAITPADNDVDKILVLTKTTTVTARDTFSQADLIFSAKIITTDLPDDSLAQGKGVVVR